MTSKRKIDMLGVLECEFQAKLTPILAM